MSTGMQAGGPGPSPSGLADGIDTILDKGLVIDAYVRVSLVGIELLTIDARIVIASVDTYLRFAEAVNRLDISQEKEGLPELVGDMQQGGAKHKTKGVLEAAGEKFRELSGDGREREPAGRHRFTAEGCRLTAEDHQSEAGERHLRLRDPSRRRRADDRNGRRWRSARPGAARPLRRPGCPGQRGGPIQAARVPPGSHCPRAD